MSRLASVAVHPETFAFSHLLKRHKHILTEDQLLLLGGGIGIGVFSFYYKKEDFSNFYIAGRHYWWDNVQWFKSLSDRLNITLKFTHSTSLNKATQQLNTALSKGPAIVWVDKALLPYYGLDFNTAGMNYHIVVADSNEGEHVSVFDMNPNPYTVEHAQFNLARSAIKKDKFRLMQIESSSPFEMETAIISALNNCTQSLLKGKMKNFTLQAIIHLSQRINSDGKDGWKKKFPSPKHLINALSSLHHYIALESTDGALLRPTFARGLRFASKTLDLPDLLAVSERYDAIGNAWSTLANTALPNGTELSKIRIKAQEVHAKIHHDNSNAGTQARLLVAELQQVTNDVIASHPKPFDDILNALHNQLSALHEMESNAANELAQLIQNR